MSFELNIVHDFGHTSKKRILTDQKVQPEKVGISQISKIMSGVYQSASISSAPSIDGSCEDSFPMQQKLVVCTMVLLCRQSKAKEVTLGKVRLLFFTTCVRTIRKGRFNRRKFVNLLFVFFGVCKFFDLDSIEFLVN